MEAWGIIWISARQSWRCRNLNYSGYWFPVGPPNTPHRVASTDIEINGHSSGAGSLGKAAARREGASRGRIGKIWRRPGNRFETGPPAKATIRTRYEQALGVRMR